MYADLDTSEPPFSLLEPEERRRAVGAMDIRFFTAGEVILEAGTEATHLFLVDKGLVEERDPGVDDIHGAVAQYRQGEVFGSLALLRSKARHRYVALEDTLCHQLPRDVFRELVYANNAFGEFFHRDLATKTKLVAQSGAYRDLVSFNLARVAGSCIRAAVVVEHDLAIRSVVEIMREAHADCVLTRRGDDFGIITRTDLLEALALNERDLDEPCGDVASWGLVTIQEGEFLFEALIRMTRHHIERLVVTRGRRPVGLVEMSDLLGFLSNHSHVIALRIESARAFPQLVETSASMVELARSLFAQRVNVRFIMDLLAELHRRILAKNYQLLVPGDIRAETCLLVLGSEGRGEQVMRTDQSNALVMGPGLDWPELDGALEQFTRRTLDLGYPRSPRGMVISNPAWRGTLEDWQERLAAWIRGDREDGMLGLSAMLDATPVAGSTRLAAALEDWLTQHLPRDQEFFGRLIRPILQAGAPPPFYVSGGRQGQEIDVKQHGIFPIVHGARTLALEKGIEASNTFLRLERLGDEGLLDTGIANDLSESFVVFNQMRLGQQLRRLEESEARRIPAEVANLVDTGQLSGGELELLRDAFRAVRGFRALLAERYGS